LGTATPNAATPWTSGTPGVATITNGGVVTGVAAGTSLITYENTNGCTTTAIVTVSSNPTITGGLTVCATKTITLLGSATPNAATPWTSGTPGVATITNGGVVTGVASGTTLITYENTNGCTTTAIVTVSSNPTITGGLAVCATKTITLLGSATPNAATPWVSGTPGVATITNGGVVTGVASGTTLITYENTNGCTTTAIVTVSANPAITGTLSACVGNSTTLLGTATPNAVTPWISGTTAVATITNGGVVTGVTAGTSLITYTNSNGCTTTAIVTINATPVITGAGSVTVGGNTTWSGTGAPGATPWVSASTGVATITAGGVITGVANGTSLITYTNSNGCSTTAIVTVNNLPSITGPKSLCLGTSVTLIGSGTAATTNPWVSSLPGIATVTNVGVVTSVAAGTTLITYTDNNGNSATQIETVNSIPIIGGTLTMCIAGSTTLTGTPTPAAVNPWVSGTATVATITTAGVVTGVTAGTSLITYLNTNGCTTTAIVTVEPSPSITGTESACVGASTTLLGSATPNATTPWTSATPGVATITNGGVVTGVASGTTLITYENTNGCTTTAIVTINAKPSIGGILSACVGASTTLTGSGTPGATPWTSAAPTVATITAGGVVTGVTGGTSLITYTNNNGCSTTAIVTIIATPIITGAGSVAVGGNTTWTGTGAPGATPWVSASLGVATITAGGVITGVANGTSLITYTNSNGCSTTAIVTVNNLPSISGLSAMCLGTSVTLTGSGTAAATTPWVSSVPGVATVNNVGVVTSVAVGTTLITYTDNHGNTATQIETVNPHPGISGTLSVCVGNNITLTGTASPDATTPWASATTTVATITTGGIVTGVSAGTSLITYLNTNGCTTTAIVTVNAPPTISGGLSVCATKSITLIGSGTPGATPWTSGTTTVATVNGTGVVTGVSAGTSLITYTNSNGCTTTAIVTVNVNPGITGTLSACVGASTTLLGSGTPGATPWTSASPSVATITAGGVVTGVAGGTSLITYTNNNGCTTTAIVTINATPTITGAGSVTIASNTTWVGSGTPNATTPWVSGSTAIATITAGGVITGVANGTSLITYTNSNGCSTTAIITVSANPTIAGPMSLCLGTSVTLIGSGTPGAIPWTSSDVTIATINSSGVVTSVGAGTTLITYTDNSGNTATQIETVNSLPTISGTLALCIGGTSLLSGTPTPNAVNPWLSANPAVATIDNTTGLVTAISAGTSLITYTNSNGCTTTAIVTVNGSPFITGTLTVCANSTTSLTGSGIPGATPWVSGTATVATIDNAGLVTGVGAGTSLITYTNSNGCTTTAIVTVNALPSITGTLSACIGNTTPLFGSGTAGATPWTSSDVTVATIDNAGVVTGVGAGTSLITYTNSNGCATTSIVTINPFPSITGSTTVTVGATTTWTGSGAPGATPWLSGSPAVATINNAGLITGVISGTSLITYTNSNGCTTTQIITVNLLPTITGTPVVCAGGTTQLTGSGTAAATTPWTSSVTSVATVDNTGLVTSIAAGTTLITYTDNNANTATVIVTVNALPSITGTLSVCVGSATPLAGTATPAAAPWASATTSVATINNAGVVTGIAAGNSLITYTNSNGCTTTAIVTVNALSSISGTLSVCVGNTTPLAATGIPGATPWTSGTPTVATIDNAGVVTGVGAGTSLITYTNSNGCITTAIVTVNGLPTISGTPTVCSGGSTTALTGSGTPNATNPWISSATSVASISNAGVVTGVSAGTTTITYTNSNGCSTTMIVTVNALPAATISYTPGTYCTSNSTPQLVTQSGTLGGVYSAPAGLSINAGSGSIVPSLSTPSTTGYQVTYTLTASGCPTQFATATVVIDPTPSLTIQNPNAVCSPATVDLTNPTVAIDHSNLPTGTILSYYYDAGATSPIATPEVIPASNTYYIVATAAGCSSPATGVTVTILNSPTAPATTDLHYCQFADAKPLSTTVTPAPGNTLIWYNAPVGGDSTLIAPTPSTATGDVTLPFYVGQEQTFGTTTCISATRSKLNVQVTTQPTASVKPSNIEAYAGDPVTFQGFATGGPITWRLNDSTAPSFSDAAIQTLTPPSSVTPPLDITTYYLVVTSTEFAECEATASVIVRVVQPLLIPNIFSPNGDGNHDKWVIQNINEFPDVEVSIFNRYGQFVFKSPDHYNTEWDGTYHGQPLPVGAYFYIIKTSGGAKPISGSVSIVR